MSDFTVVSRRDALRISAGTVVLGVTGFSAAAFTRVEAAPASQSDAKIPAQLRSIFAGQQWPNTPPLHYEDVRGKVILVNFWTYSCINSLRMLPYTRAWHGKYKDSGLVLIGVHTPEFDFEKDIANVRWASTSYGVGYPVVLDSDYDIWRAFGNEGWPALHFIDASGRIRRRTLGEGDYDKSEKLIQQLVTEAGKRPVPGDISAVTGIGPLAAPDDANLRSPETYIGYARATNFSSPGGIKKDISNVYRAASQPALNHWSLAGDWTIGKEFASLNAASGSIQYRFHARDLHLIMGRSSQSGPINFRLKIDGAPPGADHGVDVKPDGYGTIAEDRMYQLVRQTGPIKDRTVEVEYLDAGVRVYDFTFG